MTCTKGLLWGVVVAAVLMAASNAAQGAGQEPAIAGGASGVISAAGNNWVELQQADTKTQRFLLPPPTAAERAQPATSRLNTLFHVQVGEAVDMVWQMTNGQPTVVGVIVKASGPPVAAGSFVTSTPEQAPAGQAPTQAHEPSPATLTTYGWAAPSWPTGAQANPAPFESDYGTFMGFVTSKGGTEWIDVTPVYYNNSLPIRFTPMQVRPATGGDNGLDLRVQEAIRLIPVGTLVQLYWTYADGKKVVNRIIPSTQNGELTNE